MDALKKFLGLDKMDKETNKDRFGHEFRKPNWFDDNEIDDELYDSNKTFRFQIFTNPLELQKHFEQQMQAMQQLLEEFDDHPVLDENAREKYIKPGFEEHLNKEFGEISQPLDTDLDDEIYADQLHSLLQRISPEISTLTSSAKLPKNSKSSEPENRKRTDGEKILDLIHGTDTDQIIQKQIQANRARNPLTKIPQPHGGVFEGAFQGPKIFRQSIMTQTIRKPDGTYETKKIVRDADGNTNTTVTRTREGKSETFTYDNENNLMGQLPVDKNADRFVFSFNDRNIMISKSGYALPRNLW